MSLPTILLTGASNGIGRASAFALAAKNYPVALIDRDGEALAQVDLALRGAGRIVASEQADVTDRNSLEAAVGRLKTSLGPIQVLIACAGVGRLTPVPNLELDGLRAMLAINVMGVANSIDAVLPDMVASRSGHIIGISSVAGFRGLPWMASYSASKAALTAFLEGIRPALKRRGIAVTTVCPGFVRTAMTANTPFRSPVKMMSPEQAAAHIVRVVQRKPRNHVFPFGTAVGMAVLKHVPDRVFDWMMDRAGPRALTTEF